MIAKEKPRFLAGAFLSFYIYYSELGWERCQIEK